MSSPVAAAPAGPAQAGQSTRPSVAQPQARGRVARLIPAEVWARYGKKIEMLYVTADKTLTLEQLKKRMFQDHGFVAS